MLNLFKKLHRAREYAFRGDVNTLAAARQRINDDFKAKKHVTDETSIAELIKCGEEIEKALRTEVIQTRETDNGNLSMSYLLRQMYRQFLVI